MERGPRGEGRARWFARPERMGIQFRRHMLSQIVSMAVNLSNLATTRNNRQHYPGRRDCQQHQLFVSSKKTTRLSHSTERLSSFAVSGRVRESLLFLACSWWLTTTPISPMCSLSGLRCMSSNAAGAG